MVLIIFFLASLAEANRAPFDIPESESELVGGYHTEYSGFRWSMLMLAEYGMMLLAGLLGAYLFFGGINAPVKFNFFESGFISQLIGSFWLLFKALTWVFIQMVIRWTYPRLRVDQLMHVGWKYLTPFSFIVLLFSAWFRIQ